MASDQRRNQGGHLFKLGGICQWPRVSVISPAPHHCHTCHLDPLRAPRWRRGLSGLLWMFDLVNGENLRSVPRSLTCQDSESALVPVAWRSRLLREWGHNRKLRVSSSWERRWGREETAATLKTQLFSFARDRRSPLKPYSSLLSDILISPTPAEPTAWPGDRHAGHVAPPCGHCWGRAHTGCLGAWRGALGWVRESFLEEATSQLGERTSVIRPVHSKWGKFWAERAATQKPCSELKTGAGM